MPDILSIPADQVLDFRALIDRKVKTRDGETALPVGPGLGFDVDANVLDRFAVDSWA
jgi:L-alanine-DL-glutamate epimerase-like enolase superfamily enzyme